MQTHERNFTTKAKGEVYVNPESTFDWFLKEDVTSCLTILRIFYQEGPAAREIIGNVYILQDEGVSFIPCNVYCKDNEEHS